MMKHPYLKLALVIGLLYWVAHKSIQTTATQYPDPTVQASIAAPSIPDPVIVERLNKQKALGWLLLPILAGIGTIRL
jgi:hypothetical protein